MTTVEVFAPAKINLTLHVTGQRTDGYHLLDSLVVFADLGDTIRVAPAERLTLSIEGPEAFGLEADDSNLVLRAARFLDPGRGAAVTLCKRLPVASGIGGGSADAAATLKALSRLWACPLPGIAETAALGADLPVCLAGRPTRMRGVGADLGAIPPLPDLDLLLINPRIAVSTPRVFAGLTRRDNPPMPSSLPSWPDAAAFAAWISDQRNDLAAPAAALAPEIAAVLEALRDTGCLAHGMSGSGATCFALFAPDAALAHRNRLKTAYPKWWVECASMRQAA